MKTILNCKEKKCYFNYQGEDFEINLTEGDLEDNWNGITLKNGEVKDFNFSWQRDCKPSITLYRVDEDNITDFFEYSVLYFDEIVGTYDESDAGAPLALCFKNEKLLKEAIKEFEEEYKLSRLTL